MRYLISCSANIPIRMIEIKIFIIEFFETIKMFFYIYFVPSICHSLFSIFSILPGVIPKPRVFLSSEELSVKVAFPNKFQ